MLRQPLLQASIKGGMKMDGSFGVGVILLDYTLGAAMWTLIGRFGMAIFVSEQSDFFFMRAFVKFTDPMLRIMAPLTPAFLIERLKPLYVAWFLFMIRFYLMPLVLGYDVMGMLSFPLESDAALIIYDIGKIFR
jgi:uncharacterized protein YggT (Ycf19 family)